MIDSTDTDVVPYLRGKDKVIAIFKKTLGSGIGNEISYETAKSSFNEKFIGSTITLEIEKLRAIKLDDHWNEKQPNANKLIINKIATLVIYYGDVEVFSGGSTQSIQINKESIFMTWRVDSVEYLTSIASNLKNNSEASVKVDLAVDDDFFVADQDSYSAEVSKISITFN